jgi:hypothetical protein
MKPTMKKSAEGSMLVMTVIITALIGSVLGSYLVLISSRNQAAMRALAWNSAIPVLEAGIEEALTHLNDDKNDPRANSWNVTQIDGKKAYWKRGDLPDGSYFFVTNVHVTSTQPLIYSAGYVPSPLKDNQYISRLVKVTTTNPPSGFNLAIAANSYVKLSGSTIVDGYNSAAPYGGTNRLANGGVGTDSQQPNAIDVGSGHIYGIAMTGPGGTVSVAGGSVGDLNQISGKQSGWVSDDMNVYFQDNAPPTGQLPLTPLIVSAGGSNVTVLAGGNYKLDNFRSSKMNNPMFVQGNATLWVTDDFVVNGSGYVYIAPNASLTLYVGGNGSISGGGVVNGSGVPSKFSYYGLPTSTSLRYSGVADFVGTINAPEANVQISGGSSVFGAVICNTFSCSGGSSVHYDQALGGGGIFLVTQWKEM